MSTSPLALEWIPGRYAVCRLGPDAKLPEWAVRGGRAAGLLSVTRTDKELSIVAAEEAVPADVPAQRGWAAMRVAGRLDLSQVGVLAALTGALGGAGVPVLAISTYETDVLLVRSADAGRAVEALGAVADVSRLR